MPLFFLQAVYQRMEKFWKWVLSIKRNGTDVGRIGVEEEYQNIEFRRFN